MESTPSGFSPRLPTYFATSSPLYEDFADPSPIGSLGLDIHPRALTPFDFHQFLHFSPAPSPPNMDTAPDDHERSLDYSGTQPGVPPSHDNHAPSANETGTQQAHQLERVGEEKHCIQPQQYPQQQQGQQQLSSPTAGASHRMTGLSLDKSPFAYQQQVYPDNISKAAQYQAYTIQGYPISPSGQQVNYYHQYPRTHTSTSLSPSRPMSPPLSVSPPGSSSSHHHTLSASPNLASPFSAMSSTHSLPDMSPPQMGWHYPLPAADTPLTALNQLGNVSPSAPGPNVTMIPGFSYPAQHLTWGASPGGGSRDQAGDSAGGKGGRGSRGRQRGTKSSTSRVSVKREVDVDDEGDEDVAIGDDFQDAGTDLPGSTRRLDLHRSRAELEQGADKSKRRRDELREGFAHLKEALPASNQRASKTNLLDRAVLHIGSLQTENEELRYRLDSVNLELQTLKTQNQELIHALTSQKHRSPVPTPPLPPPN